MELDWEMGRGYLGGERGDGEEGVGGLESLRIGK